MSSKLAEDAKANNVSGFLKQNLKKVEKLGNESADLFAGRHPDFIKHFKLASLQKQAEKILDLIEKLEKDIKDNQFY